MFRDAGYVAWANLETVHFLSYSLDADAPKPEPTIQVVRDGEKVEVLRMYPMFTATEVNCLAAEVNEAILFPGHTPWAGVVAPDGKTILAEEPGKKSAKEFRELYVEQQKKLGPTLDRATWAKVRAALEASTTAEFDERWPDAVRSAVEARAAAKSPPKPLAERIATRIETLAKVGAERVAAAQAKGDAPAVAALRATFAPLSAAPGK